jgi:glycosyltransferase involved in cell wall biosynthesis
VLKGDRRVDALCVSSSVNATHMRIGIEIRHVHRGASGGIVPLLAEVLDRLVAANPSHEFVVYRTIFNPPLIAREHPNVHTVVLPIVEPWRHLQEAIDHDPVDVLFRAFPTLDDLVFPLSRQVVLIPDLQHVQYPEFFSPDVLRSRQLAFGRVLRGAGAIGTISEFARSTILASPENACTDVFLMPPALRTDASAGAPEATSEIVRRLHSIGPYFYYPANLWKHKNHLRVIEAFDLFRSRMGRDISFVFTGHPEGWHDISARFPHQPLHHFGFVSGHDQRAIYRGAVATAFFSLYEGFGMPLLEAFAADCPVICSDTTSLPEVGGAAILSCDPTNVSAIAHLMDQISASADLRHAAVIAGRERLGHFSWERSASELMAALVRVAVRTRPVVRQEATLVSIVTPSYNQAVFLRRTIESVLTQTYKNIEYLVIDGGSKDGSVDILKSYGNRVRWLSEADRGQAHAINKGFALCKGQVLGYLNSDDTLLPDTVEKVMDFFASRPRCDMVYGDANYIDKNDHVIGKYNTADYSFARLMLDCCVCQPAAFWRETIAAQVGPFDESLDIVMDYDYWLRIARSGGHIAHLSEVLANSRQYLETKTSSRREDVYAEIFEICRRHGGYVAPGYFYGLWDYRLHECSRLIAGSLGKVPKLSSILARGHHAWFHRHQNRQQFVQAMRRMARRARRRIAGTHVSGIWPDSWLAPHAVFATANIRGDARLFLCGHPICDGRLAVIGSGKILAERHFKAGDSVSLDFAAPGKGAVELHFSCSRRDGLKREVSFRLDGTNLLGEADL